MLAEDVQIARSLPKHMYRPLKNLLLNYVFYLRL